MFVLLARDPLAPDLVREWARRKSVRLEDPEKVVEAMAIAKEMESWKSGANDFNEIAERIIRVEGLAFALTSLAGDLAFA
jgi:hypothetical protein